MRDDEASDISVSRTEKVVREAAEMGRWDGSGRPAYSAVTPAEPMTEAPPARRSRGLTSALSSVLSAAVVIGAFILLLTAGFTGRFSSFAAEIIGRVSPAHSGKGEKPAQVATAEAPPAAATVPVLTAVSEKRPAPITTDAVGKVESIAAITVRTRVDGQIAKVLF